MLLLIDSFIPTRCCKTTWNTTQKNQNLSDFEQAWKTQFFQLLNLLGITLSLSLKVFKSWLECQVKLYAKEINKVKVFLCSSSAVKIQSLSLSIIVSLYTDYAFRYTHLSHHIQQVDTKKISTSLFTVPPLISLLEYCSSSSGVAAWEETANWKHTILLFFLFNFTSLLFVTCSNLIAHTQSHILHTRAAMLRSIYEIEPNKGHFFHKLFLIKYVNDFFEYLF